MCEKILMKQKKSINIIYKSVKQFQDKLPGLTNNPVVQS